VPAFAFCEGLEGACDVIVSEDLLCFFTAEFPFDCLNGWVSLPVAGLTRRLVRLWGGRGAIRTGRGF